MTLHEFQRRVHGFDISQEVIDAVIATEDVITRLIRTQMAFGLKGSGKIQNVFTKKYDYSVWWGEHRQSLNLQIDFFDFKVTGEFWKSISVFKVTATDYEIYARSTKTTNLVKLFTEKIFNLTDESVAEYIVDGFFPELKRRIELKLGVQFGN